MKLFFKCHESLSIEDQNYFLSTPNEMKPQLLKTLCPKIIKSTKAIQAKPKNENAYNSSTYQPPRAPRHYGIVAHALIWPGLLLGSASLTFGIVTVHSGDEVFSNMDDTSRAIMATTYFVTAGLHFVAMFAGIGLALRQKQVNEEFSLNKKKIALKVPSIFIGQNSVMLDCGFNF